MSGKAAATLAQTSPRVDRAVKRINAGVRYPLSAAGLPPEQGYRRTQLPNIHSSHSYPPKPSQKHSLQHTSGIWLALNTQPSPF
jgi:hypothetical protein